MLRNLRVVKWLVNVKMQLDRFKQFDLLLPFQMNYCYRLVNLVCPDFQFSFTIHCSCTEIICSFMSLPSTRQGNIFRSNVSRILFTGGVCLSACWHTPPPGRHPQPWQTPPWVDTPWQTPPPPLQQMATAADGTHPTGMLSCLTLGLRYSIFYKVIVVVYFQSN